MASVPPAQGEPQLRWRSWLEHRVSPGEDIKSQDLDLFPVQLELEGSMLVVPNAPGLGIEFNEELAHEQKFKFWEAPHLHRLDGSYTNW